MAAPGRNEEQGEQSAASTAPAKAAAGMTGPVARSSILTRLAWLVFAITLATAVAQCFLFLDVRTSYLVFLPVITGACALGGLEIGLCATALGMIALWGFFIPPWGFEVPSRVDLAHLCIFGIVACFGCWIIDGLRSTREELARDNAMLIRKIAALLRRNKTS